MENETFSALSKEYYELLHDINHMCETFRSQGMFFLGYFCKIILHLRCISNLNACRFVVERGLRANVYRNNASILLYVIIEWVFFNALFLANAVECLPSCHLLQTSSSKILQEIFWLWEGVYCTEILLDGFIIYLARTFRYNIWVFEKLCKHYTRLWPLSPIFSF